MVIIMIRGENAHRSCSTSYKALLIGTIVVSSCENKNTTRTARDPLYKARHDPRAISPCRRLGLIIYVRTHTRARARVRVTLLLIFYRAHDNIAAQYRFRPISIFSALFNVFVYRYIPYFIATRGTFPTSNKDTNAAKNVRN
jgi:hypothetical protein